MSNRLGNSNYFGKHEAYGNRELKYYKDIYGNDVRLMTSKEKNIINKVLVISSVFIVILIGGFFYKAYLVQKEIDERTKLYLMSGESIEEGKDIVEAGGVIVSEDSDIVAVEADGTIVAKNSGTTNITVYKNIDENDFKTVNDYKKTDGNIYDEYNSVGVEGEFTFEVTVKQKVTGVSLGMTTINLYVGETNRIYASILPHTADNKDVVWSSSDNKVATIDSKGVISARSPGVATITVTTKDGGFKDSTLVQVSKKVSKNNIYLSLDKEKMYVGDTTNLITVVSPDEKLASKVVYSSSDISVVSINSNGKITAKKKGKATITARIASEGISSSIDINVTDKEIEQLYLSSTNLSINVSDKYNLKTYFYPNDAVGTVTYTSSDSKVVSVNSDGKIVGLKEGVATITVKSNNNITAKCIVEVKNDIIDAEEIEIKLDKTTIDVGEEVTISSIVKPDNSTNKNVTYISSDNNIATVSDDGKVLGINPGNVIITVTTASGISDTISLKVKSANVEVTSIDLDPIISVEAGKSIIINSDINPKNATNKNIIWSSEDTSIAKVNSSGVVTGVEEGSTIITATIGDIQSSTVVLVSEIKAEKIELNYEQVDLFMGENITLKATISPSNTTNNDVTWISNDESIVKVDKDGKVMAVGAGTVVVTAMSNNPGIYSECIFNVSKVGVESYKLSHNQVIVTKGKKVTLSVSDIQPSNASYQDASYEIGDNSIAVVEDGVITGISPGKTTITVIVDDIKKLLDLTVVDEGEKVYFIDTYTSVSGVSDAILLESDGRYALIDTGSTIASMNTIKFLKDLGVKKLEFILITHFHSENFGGIYGENPTNNILLSDIKVDKVYMKAYSGSDSYFVDSSGNLLTDSSDISDRRKLRLGMYTDIRDNIINSGSSFVQVNSKMNSLELGEFDLDLYNVEDQLKSYSSKCLSKYNCSENSNSIVTYVRVNGKSLYLASDIYNAYNGKDTKYLKKETELEIAKTITKKENKNIDIYKAANYGYDTSNVKDALKKIKPNYSIVTNSKDNFDSSSEAIKRIDKYTNNDIYYAGDGTVIVNIDSEGNIDFVQLND